MDNILIRKATVEDAFGISSLIKDSMGYYNPPQIIRENLQRLENLKTDYVIVAVYNDEIIGLAHAENYDSLYSLPLKDLMSLAVKTEFQNRKIGKKLMAEIEKWAVETGRSGIRVLSSSDRTAAHGFYQTIGYKFEKCQHNFYKYF
jgi:predicted N-acetyltransferase YhbS